MSHGVVNITIATYNRLECTRECIETLVARTSRPYRLVVVDNGSTDKTPEYLQELHNSNVIHTLALLGRNMGVACGYNIGWSLCQADYYMKVDNDVVFLRDDWLDKLIHYADTIADVAKIGFDCNSTGVGPAQDLPDILHYMAHIGQLVLIRADVHKRLGYWCEDYGFYGEEDSDYGMRARLAGYVNLALCERENPYIAFSDIEKDPQRDAYCAWKTTVRQQLGLRMYTLNEALYKTGLRDLAMGRMYLERLNGTQCSCTLNRQYVAYVAMLEKRYGPHIDAIIASEEYQKIHSELAFNVWF